MTGGAARATLGRVGASLALLPCWGARPKAPQGSITGTLVIDICARQGVREEVIVVSHVPAARRRPRTQLDVAGELDGALAHMQPPPKGEPLIPVGRPLTGSDECLQPDRVNELKPGQIDDQTGRLACVRIELTVEQRGGASVELAAQPQDQHVSAALAADGECGGRASLWFPDHGDLAAIPRDFSALLVHACSKYRSGP